MRYEVNPQLYPALLHPASCTLHPAPFTLILLHPAPCTLHPVPYTPHPAPYTPHPIPYTLPARSALDPQLSCSTLLLDLNDNSSSTDVATRVSTFLQDGVLSSKKRPQVRARGQAVGRAGGRAGSPHGWVWPCRQAGGRAGGRAGGVTAWVRVAVQAGRQVGQA